MTTPEVVSAKSDMYVCTLAADIYGIPVKMGLTAGQAANLVRDLLPYAAYKLGLRYWDGEWWTQTQYACYWSDDYMDWSNYVDWNNLPVDSFVKEPVNDAI